METRESPQKTTTFFCLAIVMATAHLIEDGKHDSAKTAELA